LKNNEDKIKKFANSTLKIIDLLLTSGAKLDFEIWYPRLKRKVTIWEILSLHESLSKGIFRKDFLLEKFLDHVKLDKNISLPKLNYLLRRAITNRYINCIPKILDKGANFFTDEHEINYRNTFQIVTFNYDRKTTEKVLSTLLDYAKNKGLDMVKVEEHYRSAYESLLSRYNQSTSNNDSNSNTVIISALDLMRDKYTEYFGSINEKIFNSFVNLNIGSCTKNIRSDYSGNTVFLLGNHESAESKDTEETKGTHAPSTSCSKQTL